MAERLRRDSGERRGATSDEPPRLGEFGCYVAGRWLKTGDRLEVLSPYDGSLVAVVHRAGPDEIEAAIAHATDAFETTRHLPVWKRAAALEAISAGLAERREDLAQTIALEAGKPIAAARATVSPARSTARVGWSGTTAGATGGREPSRARPLQSTGTSTT